MKNKKIAVKIWHPTLEKLDIKLELGSLRRDAFINKVLAIELTHLENEITLPNSIAALNFVTEKLNLLPKKTVTFTIQTKLADLLDEICEKKLIVRDAFFNRLLLMLAATPQQIDRLFGGVLDSDWINIVWKKHQGEWEFFSEIFYPFEPSIDPFWVIREGIALSNERYDSENSFYGTLLTDRFFKNVDLFGFNCFIPEHEVPNSKANLAFLDDL